MLMRLSEFLWGNIEFKTLDAGILKSAAHQDYSNENQKRKLFYFKLPQKLYVISFWKSHENIVRSLTK